MILILEDKVLMGQSVAVQAGSIAFQSGGAVQREEGPIGLYVYFPIHNYNKNCLQ